ncbi:transketolase family protein [Liquorilactobacillus mali]|uniref:Transketolase, beta subunit n=1 Tax=Liquorilactobacillus mali TaxID=1618 RepID=A0A0R2FW47_9LACO|nr:transketolase C-terminal domain-containing protein [Liquorilactobacillus mali]KRN31654.1 transketolase, beta subunit [Liquorilactobacillus mali]
MSEQAKIGDVIVAELSKAADKDRNILAVTSDSRGSASLAPYIKKHEEQLVEIGIAEQNSVTVSGGLAHSGKRPFVFAPAAFLTMRSIEQVKVDVSYSNNNVKLIGISGGNSYKDLGATHHSLQDLAITRAIPNLEVYTPADQYQAAKLIQYLAISNEPAYVRIGKVALPNIYSDTKNAFIKPGKANIVVENGTDVALVSSGETLHIAIETASLLKMQGINATVVDLVSIKPLDIELLNQLADKTNLIVTLEEHSLYGGLGSAVAEALSPRGDIKLELLVFLMNQ